MKNHLKPSTQPDSTLLVGDSGLWASVLERSLPVEGVKGADKDTMVKIYEQRQWEPVFVTPHFELSKEAVKFLQRLGELEDDAVAPAPYRLSELQKSIQRLDQLRLDTQSLKLLSQEFGQELEKVEKAKGHHLYADLTGLSPFIEHAGSLSGTKSLSFNIARKIEDRSKELFQEASKIDVQLTANLIRFARTMRPNDSVEARIQPLLDRHSVTAEFLEGLEPPSPRYTPLRRAFKQYRNLVLNKQRKPLYFKHSLKKGESGNSVRQLQERLKQEGLYDGKISGRFDDATVEAVCRFQRRHLLKPDGSVGAVTRNCLNIPFEEKAQMLACSLDSLRQNYTPESDRFVKINIPRFQLEYYNEGKLKAVHRVIVGKPSPKDQTPSFAGTIERIVFNPNWYVSDRIRLEMGDVASNKGYFQMSSLYPWGEPRLGQLPGPTNPLGRVKFEFPNPHAVFVHDTPNKHLFNRPQRSLSHGCVRLENALDFARILLRDDQNPAADKIDVYTGRKNQTFVKLNQPVPIILEYLPASIDENKEIIFLGDPYGRSKTVVKKAPKARPTRPKEGEQLPPKEVSDV